MRLTLEWPPSANHLYPTVMASDGRVRRVRSGRARQYAESVAVAILLWKSESGEEVPKPPFALRVLAYPPDAKRRDLGNLEKVAVDSIFRIIGYDDSLIHEIHLIRVAVDRKNPRLEVTLEHRDEQSENRQA